jgi:pyroglutamyl-peptidase
MNNHPLRLLVTGFGPFPGIPKNPSEIVAGAIARSPHWRHLDIDVRMVPLSTTYAALADELLPAIRDFAPDALLMVGVAGRSRDVRVETRALNRASILLPDAAKVRPGRWVMPGESHLRRSQAHPARQVATLRRRGWRARSSTDAGPYLCNASYFNALATPIPVLFVHIPKPGRARPAAPGAPRRAGWHDMLGNALAEVALDLIRQARRAEMRAIQPARTDLWTASGIASSRVGASMWR